MIKQDSFRLLFISAYFISPFIDYPLYIMKKKNNNKDRNWVWEDKFREEKSFLLLR